MERVIAYAVGTVFEKQKNNIKWENVVAVSDRNVASRGVIHGKPFIPPQEIADYEYDYVAVFSSRHFETIRLYLTRRIGISEDRILSWQAFTGANKTGSTETAWFIREYAESMSASSVLISHFPEEDMPFLLPEDLRRNQGTRMDLFGEDTGRCDNLFDHRFSYMHDIVKDDYSLIVHFLEEDEKQAGLALFDKMDSYNGRLLLVMNYKENLYDHMKEVKSKISDGCDCRLFFRNSFAAMEITPARIRKKIDGHIYIVKHKPYYERKGDLYKTICVGGYRDNDKNVLYDDTGDSIASLNSKINECTALYWIWKNTTEPIVGINHYRRYFANEDSPDKNNYLQADRLQKYLSEADIILAKRLIPGISVHEHLEKTILPDALKQAESLIVEAIEKRQPDYMNTYHQVMNGYVFYPSNLLICYRHAFNQYCEWLFSIILEPAEKFDATPYDAYSARAVGFFAERLLTVWIVRQKLKIKELPVICENEG